MWIWKVSNQPEGTCWGNHNSVIVVIRLFNRKCWALIIWFCIQISDECTRWSIMWLLHRCRTLFSSVLSVQAEPRGLLWVRNVTSQTKGDSTSARSAFSYSASKDGNKLPVDLKICTDLHSVCRCNMSRDYRLKNMPSAGCIVADCGPFHRMTQSTSTLTFWSKIKRVCSLTSMTVCNVWTCKTCVYTLCVKDGSRVKHLFSSLRLNPNNELNLKKTEIQN